MDKRFSKEIEKKIRKGWDRKNIYKFNIRSKKPIFSIDTPPPYPSGKPWHIGAAAHYSQIDMIARAARMMGNEVYFPIGIDRNCLPVELYTEKKYKIDIRKISREKFIKYCQKALDDLEDEMINIMKDMGMSGDFKKYYRTDSLDYRKLTQTTFIELWKKDLIYEATRPNNYCIGCNTTIADAEIIYKELPTELIYVKFKHDKKDLIVATTRPELLCSCDAVLYNPKDDRYKGLKGKIKIPLYNREVSLIPHASAKPEFGSGLLMVCSYGDYEDVRIFRDLKLKERIAIDEKGLMTKSSGKYTGMSILEARKEIINDLEKNNLITKKEKIVHRTPTCERSGDPIEIISMKEYYLRQMKFLPTIKKYANKLKFLPNFNRQILLNWIKSITMDWPISRRRIYGTEIPLWYCRKCKKIILPKPGKYYQPWKEKIKCRCGG